MPRNALSLLVALVVACGGGKAPRVPAATCAAAVDDAAAALKNAETWPRRIALAAALVATLALCPAALRPDDEPDGGEAMPLGP